MVSTLAGEFWLAQLMNICYSHADIRPAWVGPYYPMTDDPALYALCGWAQQHYLYYESFVKEFLGPDVITALDLGCGAGHTTSMLARHIETVVGLDLDPATVAFARQYNSLDDRVCYIDGRFPFSGVQFGGFDRIFCVEVLEHVNYMEQWDFLDACIAALRPAGLLLLTTPNETSAAPPHIGIITPSRLPELTARYRQELVQIDGLQNQPPGLVSAEYDPRRPDAAGASHYRMVFQRV